jgi:hypothetical protein
MDLIDSDPPSPIEDEAIPQITAAAGDSEGDRRPNLQLDGANFTPEALIQKRPIQATSTNPPAQLRGIYSQSLPYANPYAVRQDQDQYPLPPRSIPLHAGTTTHDQPATYSSYAAGPVLTSLHPSGSRDALPPAEQDRRPLPQRSAVPRTGTATRQLPAAYNSYATGPIRASVPTASPQGTLPPVNQNRHQLPARWPVPYADTTTGICLLPTATAMPPAPFWPLFRMQILKSLKLRWFSSLTASLARSNTTTTHTGPITAQPPGCLLLLLLSPSPTAPWSADRFPTTYNPPSTPSEGSP